MVVVIVLVLFMAVLAMMVMAVVTVVEVVVTRDGVLEASASARGGLEAVFLAGSASPRPHTVLPRSRPYCLGLGSAS